MKIELPGKGKKAVGLSHFPTKFQAFVFRAYEYIPPNVIARILETSEEKVRELASDMGLEKSCDSRIWLEKGYITIIRRMWHILPYCQLLELLGMDEETLAVIMREEDFLDYKLGDKPICERVIYRELTPQEQQKTAEIKAIMQKLNASEWFRFKEEEPFAFRYNVSDMKFSGDAVFDLRMVYCFSGLYQHAFDVDSRTYCPNEMLEAYRKVGINALWTQGVLFQLTEFPFYKELSEGYQQRIERLREFTERCEHYGIKVFLYLNEPRPMPQSFYEKYPKIKGHNAKNDKICMCTSTEEVQTYLKDSVEQICRSVPKLGGFFTITRSENPTNCYSHSTEETCTCERCAKRGVSDVIAEVIGCIEEGAHRVDPGIKIIAWNWAWGEYSTEIIRKLPQSVIFMSKSELELPFQKGGVSGVVNDYSMSNVGPSDKAKAEWAVAKACGIRTAAKVQVNTTWEGSTVPALPVYPLIEEHIRRIREEGVSNLMLSWTLGGYPSKNLMHAAKYFYEQCDETALGEDEVQQKAARLFAEAFQEFPFHIDVLYQGPQNAGPSNLLYLEPTGYTSTMTCYAYDDFDTWRSIYPRDIFEQQLARLCEKWRDGLRMLGIFSEECFYDAPSWDEMKVMAVSAYCLYESCLNQFRFYLARERGDKPEMIKAAEAEISCTKRLLLMMKVNAAIGFEAANHYYYSQGSLYEKIINCHDIIARCS